MFRRNQRHPTESSDASEVVRAECDSTTRDNIEDELLKPPDVSSTSSRSPPSYETSCNVAGYSPAQPVTPMPMGNRPPQPLLPMVQREPPYFDMPLRVLSTATLIELSNRMDVEEPLIKHWQFFASEVGLRSFEVSKIKQAMANQMKAVIEMWISTADPTIRKFYDILVNELGRVDVWTDVKGMIEKDSQRHIKREEYGWDKIFHPNPQTTGTGPTSLKDEEENAMVEIKYEDGNESSLHVAPGVRSGLEQIKNEKVELQESYDVFLIYDMADGDFVKELLNRLKNEDFKVCIPQRDLPGGSTEYDTNLHFMFDRSRKVVIVKSDELFASNLWKWHMNMLIGSDPVAKQRKIIPVKYKDISTQNILEHLCCCDRTTVLEEEWFWTKLFNSIKHGS